MPTASDLDWLRNWHGCSLRRIRTRAPVSGAEQGFVIGEAKRPELVNETQYAFRPCLRAVLTTAKRAALDGEWASTQRQVSHSYRANLRAIGDSTDLIASALARLWRFWQLVPQYLANVT